jgi:hypothetical protein
MPQPGDSHASTNITYKTSLDQAWSAVWVGDKFHHLPANAGYGQPHDDIWINYKTWDNSNWWAKWNPTTNRFVHVADASGPNGASHEDVILNYVAWDGDKWTAIRNGQYFVHIYVAGASDSNSGIFGKLLNVVDVAGQIIQIAVSAAPMVSGT